MDEVRANRTVAMEKQGLWTKWENASQQKSCPFSSGRGTLEHLLSSGLKTLGDGRYHLSSWQLLRVLPLLSTPRTVTTNLRPAIPKSWGEASQTRSGLLTTATDWKLEVDLGKQLKFPAKDNINTVATRPDHCVRFHPATYHAGSHSTLGRAHGQEEVR